MSKYIHFISDNGISTFGKKCLDSFKSYLPDYEILLAHRALASPARAAARATPEGGMSASRQTARGPAQSAGRKSPHPRIRSETTTNKPTTSPKQAASRAGAGAHAAFRPYGRVVALCG